MADGDQVIQETTLLETQQFVEAAAEPAIIVSYMKQDRNAVVHGPDHLVAIGHSAGIDRFPFVAHPPEMGKLQAEAIEPVVDLAQMKESEEVVEDYRTTRLSLRAHPVSFPRA